MKLLRFGPKGQEKPGILDAGGQVRDLAGRVPDFAGDGVSLAAIRQIDPGEPAGGGRARADRPLPR